MKILPQRTAIRFTLIEDEGGGVYLSQAVTDKAIAWLRAFYADRLASVAPMQPESHQRGESC